MTDFAVIGDNTRTEFRPLMTWLKSSWSASAVRIHNDIADWERTNPATHRGLTIVLQSWSDEFAPADVHRLIGSTLTSGLLCCCGAWCEGDGRTRTTWPHALRVPIRYAQEVIAATVGRQRSGHGPLPPTAARDEVFLHRVAAVRQPSKPRYQILIMSSDRPYRETLATILNSWDCRADHCHPDTQDVSIQSPELLIVDSEPRSADGNRTYERWQNRFPHATVHRMSHQPTSDAGEDVLPKLDPFLAATRVVKAA